MSPIDAGNEVGGIAGALIGLGPDLTVAEWSRVLHCSPEQVAKVAQDHGQMLRGTDLEKQARAALAALAFGDADAAREALRKGLQGAAPL